MFRSQGQESTALRQRPTSRTGRALVLEIKHKDHYTRRRAIGQTHRRRTVSSAGWRRRGGKSGVQFAPNKRRTGAQRPELSPRDLPRERNHAAVRARIDSLGRNVPERAADRRRDVLGALHVVGRDIDGADEYVLATQQ